MSTSTLELVSMVESLPIEEKALLVEKLLVSMYPNQKEIDDLWTLRPNVELKRCVPVLWSQYPATRFSRKSENDFADDLFVSQCGEARISRSDTVLRGLSRRSRLGVCAGSL